MQSQHIRMQVAAGETMRQVVPFSMKEPVDLSRFRLTELTAKISSSGDDKLRAEWSVPVIIDHEYQLPSRTAQVDGDFVICESGKIAEIQTTGEEYFFSREQYNMLFDLASEGVSEIIEKQKKCLSV